MTDKETLDYLQNQTHVNNQLSDIHLQLLHPQYVLPSLMQMLQERSKIHCYDLSYQVGEAKWRCILEKAEDLNEDKKTRAALIKESQEYYAASYNCERFSEIEHYCVACAKMHTLYTCACENLACTCGCPHGCVC